MQRFKYLPITFLAVLFLANAPVFAQQTEEKEETRETEIIIITETIDENGNKNVNKTVHKGNFTEEEIEKIVEQESGDELHMHERHGNEFINEHEGHEKEHMGLHEEHDGQHNEHARGFLGVNIENADEQGVKITNAIEGSPAENAGLTSGDVIKSVNGETVENMKELIDAVGSFGVGEEVEVTYAREGAPATVKVTLAERPESELEEALEQVDKFKWVEKAETKSKPRLGVYIESAENGVAITSISENSIAESADLKSGDVITSFNGVSVSSPDALIEAVQQSPTGQAVVVEFQRDGEKMTKTVTFENK